MRREEDPVDTHPFVDSESRYRAERITRLAAPRVRGVRRRHRLAAQLRRAADRLDT